MKPYLVLILVIFGLFACNREEPSGEHQQDLDSLLTELEQMNNQLNSLDIGRVQRMHDSLAALYDTTEIGTEPEKQHPKLEQARNILNWYDNIYREITFSRSHLRALQRQTKGKKMDTITIQEINREQQIISNLKDRFDEEYKGLKSAIRNLREETSIQEPSQRGHD